ncbi:hypothetical protein BH10ACT11_BH10ACT11_15660 [soil metagenome]
MIEPLPKTVVLGGGIAGLEALMALADLAGERTELTLVAPDPDFQLRPMVVEEPFTSKPAEQHELGPIAEGLGAKLLRGAVAAVDPAARAVDLADGTRLDYDFLVACVGGRTRSVYKNATTLLSVGAAMDIDRLLADAATHESHRIAFVVPPGVTWTLPLYEIALMSRRRAVELGHRELEISLCSPEVAPLVIFGSAPSIAVAELLKARKIDFHGDADVRETPSGSFETPANADLEAGVTIALPVIDGPMLPGLPHDDGGFAPIDDHARIRGVERVYAAGDGTNFPIKQGGLGTQQADAAAEHIAEQLGADLEAAPFHPVLRGKLIIGGESLNLSHDLTGESAEGVASADYLWWPPHKVSGRYLAAWFAHEPVRADPGPRARPLEIEIALPHEWHEDPKALNPYGPAG